MWTPDGYEVFSPFRKCSGDGRVGQDESGACGVACPKLEACERWLDYVLEVGFVSCLLVCCVELFGLGCGMCRMGRLRLSRRC